MTHRPVVRPHALVVAYHFPPDAGVGTLRTLRLVRHLAQQFDVTVLTSDPRTYRDGTPRDDALLKTVPPGVRIIRAPVLRGLERIKSVFRRGRNEGAVTVDRGLPVSNEPRGSRGVLLRLADVIDAACAIPDQESGWYWPALKAGLGSVGSHKPDVVYSSAPAWTGQLVAGTLAALLRRPWVADFRDPWGRAPWRGDRFPFAMRAARVLERQVVRCADRVLFVSRGNYDEFTQHYGLETASKFRVVPNGCDLSEFAALHRHARGAGPFVLLHAGSLYAGRTPGPLFAAIARGIREGLIDAGRFRLRFIGAISLPGSEITETVQKLNLSEVVEFLPRVPREQGLQAMLDASALLLLQPNHAVAVPAKFYEYLAAGRPMLAIATGETAALVEQSGGGICTDGNDERNILRALLEVMRIANGSDTRPAPELYDGERRAAEMAAVVSEVLPGGMTRQNECEPEAVTLSRWSRT